MGHVRPRHERGRSDPLPLFAPPSGVILEWNADRWPSPEGAVPGEGDGPVPHRACPVLFRAALLGCASLCSPVLLQRGVTAADLSAYARRGYRAYYGR